MINSICVLGGGTSGLIASLMLKKSWPDVKITMIESSKFGIVGVGEGSTEHWKKFLEHVGITVPDLVRETGATFKMGIKFTNWHGDGTHYFHSLAEQFGGVGSTNGIPFTFAKLVADNVDPLDTAWWLSQESRHVEPLHDIISQYHFDTFKLNNFLHNVCRERGIEMVDTEIAEVVLDENGNVMHLIDVNGNKHGYEFFIDCSGFKRVISSKLGVNWVAKSDELPMNAALAFPTEYKEDIPSYTESTALGSGWVWRIPTQERFGNGYVFCDSFINETQAFDEVSNYYKNNLDIQDTLEVGKKFKFKAGYVDKFWVKNCVTAGLASVFVEPLEASSIGTTIQQIFMLIPALYYYERNESTTADRYNKHITAIAENIVDFIQLHYFTQREDTEFWKWCKHNIKLTDFNKENLEYFKNNFVNGQFFNAPMIMFSQLNYIQVMHGLRLFNVGKLKEKYDAHLSKEFSPYVNKILADTDRYSRSVPSFPHRTALEMIKERYEYISIQL